MTGTVGSAALAFVLGLRHGLDADHLAAIDGLTRWNASERRGFAPYCGVLFSAGHSAVILFAAIAFALLAGHWAPPAWLGPVGIVVSAATLLLLGALNLRVALHSSGSRPAQTVGLRAGAFASLLRAPRSWQVALLGGLFAISFDAIALAGLFAASGSAEGVSGAGGLALVFALGMLSVGAANGFWVVRLVKHSGDAGHYASRVMTLTIALVSLFVGACVLLPLAFEPLEDWMASHEFAVSGFVVTIVLSGYFAALTLTNRSRLGQRSDASGAPNILTQQSAP